MSLFIFYIFISWAPFHLNSPANVLIQYVLKSSDFLFPENSYNKIIIVTFDYEFEGIFSGLFDYCSNKRATI